MGGDSHVCTYGALNVAAVAVESGETASVFATGKLWFRVPKTIRVLFEGEIPGGVFAKDIALALAKEIGVNGANYRALEYGGSGLGQISMEGRFTITNMAVDTGAKTGVMEADETTLAWARGVGREEAPTLPDADADYEKTIRIDLSSLVPVVAAPPHDGQCLPHRGLRRASGSSGFRWDMHERPPGGYRDCRKNSPGPEGGQGGAVLCIAHFEEDHGRRRRERRDTGAERCGRRCTDACVRPMRFDDGERCRRGGRARDHIREPELPGPAGEQGGGDIPGLSRDPASPATRAGKSSCR